MTDAKDKSKKDGKPKYNMWQNCGYMIGMAWREKEKKVLVLSFLTALFTVAVNLINLYISPSVLSAVENRASISRLIIIVLVFAGLLMICTGALAYIDRNIQYGRIQVRMAVIAALNKKAATTSYPNVFDEKFIKLLTKSGDATCSNSQATEAIWITVTNLFKNILGFIIYMLLLFSLDFWLLIVIVATTLTGYFIGKRVNEYEYRHREELSEYESKMWYINGRAEDFGVAKDIRIFGMRAWLEELSRKAMEAFTSFHRKANGIYIWGRIADLILAFIRNGIAYAYLITMVLDNGLSASEFLLYFSAVGGFTSWVSGILGDLSVMHRQSLDISTVRECIEYPEPFKFNKGEPLYPDNEKEYELKLVNVSFKYPESEEYVLEHINLTLKPGEKLAVVGLNGAGKTTLVKLMCGFYEPTLGKVLLNGRDIREYNRRDYYKMFSAVFQSFSLLAATIAANVAQSEDSIDMERVRECVNQAGLLEKTQSLPDGFETYLNRSVYENAVMLSGGETQRLMLARALYKEAPIIILDEPTAALDPIAEANLYQKYNEMTLGKSSVYISHRLASTKFCDRIIFIEDNRITEEGTHQELINKGGRYSELFLVQSKYYRDEVSENEESKR